MTKLFMVEFGFGENFESVDTWDSLDDLVQAETAEEAAKEAACTDGLEDALFQVYEMVLDEFGGMEPHDAERFSFQDEIF